MMELLKKGLYSCFVLLCVFLLMVILSYIAYNISSADDQAYLGKLTSSFGEKSAFFLLPFSIYVTPIFLLPLLLIAITKKLDMDALMWVLKILEFFVTLPFLFLGFPFFLLSLMIVGPYQGKGTWLMLLSNAIGLILLVAFSLRSVESILDLLIKLSFGAYILTTFLTIFTGGEIK